MMVIVALIFLLLLNSFHGSSAPDSCPKCGNMDVPYPLSSNENCGLPSYRVYCNSGSLEFLAAQGFFYKILSINPNDRSLIIKPPQIQKNTCQTEDFLLGGLKLADELPFNISKRNTVMLLNCPDTVLLSPLNCSLTSPCREFEETVEEARGCKQKLCCSFLKDSAMTSRTIRLRAQGCSAYTSVVDILPGASVDKWNFGIELQWLPPN